MRLPKTDRPENRHPADDPIETNIFEMLVPSEGYCWTEGVRPSRLFGAGNADKLGAAPYMVMKAAAHWGSPPIQAASYFPFKSTPQLFRLFRDLPLDGDSILSFANRYGWIGETGRVDDGKNLWIPAVSVHHWQKEIQTMIVSQHLWDCIQRDDRNILRQYFVWDRTSFDVRLSLGIHDRQILSKSSPSMLPEGQMPGGTHPFRTFEQWLITSTNADVLKAIGWNRGDVLGPARLTVMNLVNPRLAAYCHPHLYLDKRGKPVGHLTPVNLLGCIWLQFYLTMIGRLKLRLCTVCKKEIDVSESRSTRKMHKQCSKRERMQRYRLKKRAALR